MYLTELRWAASHFMVPCESAEASVASVAGMSDRLQASSCLEMVAAIAQVLFLLSSSAEMPQGCRNTRDLRSAPQLASVM